MRALYFEPWHGQSSSALDAAATATLHPWWVQTALKATTFPAVGCATMMSAPLASLAATAPPTGTLLSATRPLTAGAADDAAVVGAEDAVLVADEDAVLEDAVVGGTDDAAEDPAEVVLTGAADVDVGAVEAADGDDELADAVLELPQAASVNALAPSPAATRA